MSVCWAFVPAHYIDQALQANWHVIMQKKTIKSVKLTQISVL